MSKKIDKKKYQIITLNKKDDEIYGALCVDGKIVSEGGWWRTKNYDEALEKAVTLYERGQLPARG